MKKKKLKAKLIESEKVNEVLKKHIYCFMMDESEFEKQLLKTSYKMKYRAEDQVFFGLSFEMFEKPKVDLPSNLFKNWENNTDELIKKTKAKFTSNELAVLTPNYLSKWLDDNTLNSKKNYDT